MDRLQIMSLNTRGLRNKLKRKAVFTFIKNQQVDIACLQETHITQSDVHLWEKEWGGKLRYHKGSQHGRGEIILVAKHFQGEVILKKQLDRIMIVSVTANSKSYTIANVYAPNQRKDKIQFLNRLHAVLTEYKNNLIIAGDFNLVMSNDLDIISGNAHSKDDINKFNHIINQMENTTRRRKILHMEQIKSFYSTSSRLHLYL